jgi:hypothetical protein
MLMNGGVHRGQRLLGAALVRDMTRDQLSPEQKAVSTFFPMSRAATWSRSS